MILKCETCVLYVAKTCNIDTFITIFWGKGGEGEGEGTPTICELNVYVAGSRNMSKGFNLWGLFLLF